MSADSMLLGEASGSPLGVRPVKRFALAQVATPEAWATLRGDLIRHMEERLVLEAFRQNAGLIERPRYEIEGRVWAFTDSEERPTLPGETPTHYSVRMSAKAVILDG